MFNSFFRKDNPGKKQIEINAFSENYTICDYVPVLKELITNVDIDSVLDPDEELFLKRIKNLPNTLEGVHAAYDYLNNYIMQLSKFGASRFFESILPGLIHIHEKMLIDPALNWYGTPKPFELQTATTIYKGELQYNQRMEHFLTSAANKINRAIRQIPKRNEVGSHFDADFLRRYVSGKLTGSEIAELDEIHALFKEKEIDFVTVQTALQLFRYIIAKKENSAQNENFISSRSGLIPAAFELGHISGLYQRMVRIEGYLPEGDIKDFYEESQQWNTPSDPPREIFIMNMNAKFIRNGILRSAFTPLEGHYTKYMDVILTEIGKESITGEKNGRLPYYDAQGGRLLKAFFGKVSYPDPFPLQKKPGIWNSTIPFMVKDLKEKDSYPGESLYKHLARLYIIAILTPNGEVREEACARLEWWYSNIMPYFRGSAAVAEGMAKLPLLVNNVQPSQMKGHILPDLGAICQYDESEYVTHHQSFYKEKTDRPHFTSREKKPYPSPPLPDLDQTNFEQKNRLKKK